MTRVTIKQPKKPPQVQQNRLQPKTLKAMIYLLVVSSALLVGLSIILLLKIGSGKETQSDLEPVNQPSFQPRKTDAGEEIQEAGQLSEQNKSLRLNDFEPTTANDTELPFTRLGRMLSKLNKGQPDIIPFENQNIPGMRIIKKCDGEIIEFFRQGKVLGYSPKRKTGLAAWLVQAIKSPDGSIIGFLDSAAVESSHLYFHSTDWGDGLGMQTYVSANPGSRKTIYQQGKKSRPLKSPLGQINYQTGAIISQNKEQAVGGLSKQVFLPIFTTLKEGCDDFEFANVGVAGARYLQFDSKADFAESVSYLKNMMR